MNNDSNQRNYWGGGITHTILMGEALPLNEGNYSKISDGRRRYGPLRFWQTRQEQKQQRMSE